MKISLFAHAKDHTVVPWEGTWEEFSEGFEGHDFSLTQKTAVPAFSAAEYPSGVFRGNKNVKQLWLFVLDVDGVTDERALEVIEGVQKRGLAALVYSTWGHAKAQEEGLCKFRVVIPLSEPVPVEEWPGFWMRANSLFGGVCDSKVKDPARIFFAAYAPPGTEDEAFFERYEGHPLDVATVREIPLAEVEVSIPDLQKLSIDKLRRHAKRLTRRKDDRSVDLGETLLKVCEGEVFAEPGARDTTIYELSLDLGERFLRYTPESIGALFGASLALMEKQAPDCPTIKDVAYKVERRQNEVRQERQSEEEKELELKHGRIREAFMSSRTEPYTEEEIESFGPRIHKRWVIRKGSSFYLFVNGTYRGPYSETEVVNAAECDLSPAVTAGVELFYVNDKGQLARKSPQRLVSEHGKVAQKISVDLKAQHTVFEEHTSTIIEAPCPLRPIKPKYHEAVDQWMRALAGDKYELLCRWWAALTWLDRPCAALLLTGMKDVGKSMMAKGLARPWTTNGPTPLEDCFSNFNDSLAHCPLTFADEQLPKDSKGHAKNAELRHHIQATTRAFKRKFMPNTSMHGATRTIVCANNKAVLSTNETLTAEDISAISDRYLHIPVQPAAAEYLKKTDTSGWVDEDMIAEHALWLRENHKWEPEGRFLIRDPDDTLARSLAVKTQGSSKVSEWLVNYLMHPEVFHAHAGSKMLVRIHEKRLLVNSRGIIKCWNLYQDEKRPSTTYLVQDLVALCTESKKRIQIKNFEIRSGVTNYYEVDIRNLKVWNRDAGFMTDADFKKALEKDSEEVKKSLPKKGEKK